MSAAQIEALKRALPSVRVTYCECPLSVWYEHVADIVGDEEVGSHTEIRHIEIGNVNTGRIFTPEQEDEILDLLEAKFAADAYDEGDDAGSVNLAMERFKNSVLAQREATASFDAFVASQSPTVLA